ncbi:MAG: hypothetical protein ACRDU4_01110 [Mycobacterium sp.]
MDSPKPRPPGRVPGARVAYPPMDELDRAITVGRTEGFVKLTAGPRRLSCNAGGGRLLGATIDADRAGQMIHEAVLTLRTGMFTRPAGPGRARLPIWTMAVQIATGTLTWTESPSTTPSRSPWPASATAPPAAAPEPSRGDHLG